MTRRDLPAGASGPVTVHAALLQQAGVVNVRVDPNCDRASLVVSTLDEHGPSAETVRAAALRWRDDGRLSAYVEGDGGSTVVGGTGGPVFNGPISGVQLAWGNGNVVQNGTRLSGSNSVSNNGVQHGNGFATTPAAAPVEVTAVVPPGSILVSQTTSADILATGLTQVDASTQSGEVVINHSGQVTARTMSGDISVRDFSGGSVRAETQSGGVNIAAGGGGDLTVGSMTGNINITAADVTTAAQLRIQTNTITGRVNVPQTGHGTAPRTAAGSTDGHAVNRGWSTGPRSDGRSR